jgi:fibronectin type 3 domain-containing protein
VEQWEGAGIRRPSRHARRLLTGALALLVLGLSSAVPPAHPSAPQLRLASTANPAPPTNVQATTADRALTVSWTAPAEAFISGYRVYLDSALVASPTGTSTTVSGLVNGRAYSVTVITVTNVLGSVSVGTTASAPVSGTPKDAVAPAAPTAVAAVRGDGRVTLSWTANSGDYDADGYRVLRGGAPLTGLLVGATTNGYLDTAVVNDTTYGYAVQTHDTSGNWSSSSTPLATATPTDLTPPPAPTGVMGGRGDGRAGLAWDANPEPDLADYRVLRDGVEIATVTATNYLDLGRTNDTTYTYALVAVDTHGNRSAPSATVAVTPTDLTPPDAPTGLVATRGDGRVTLSWTPNGEPDLASYRVVRDLVEIATVTGSTEYVDPTVTNDVQYTYTLAAVDTHGNRSVSSASVSATPTDLGAPAVPTGLVATAGDGQVSLSWTANAEADLSTYRLLRDGVQVAALSGTSYVDTGLTDDTAYSWTLAAVDTHGNRSADSAPVTATPTDLAAPAAPTGPGAARGDGRVDLSWTANADPDVATYRVLRNCVEIAAVTGTTYADVGRTNDVTYTYTLVAVDGHGNRSPVSSPASATPTDLTPPAGPTGLVGTRGTGKITLAWNANTEPDLATYRVLRDGVEIATVTGTTYVDNGRPNGTAYTYAIVAVDTHGNRSTASAPSAVAPGDVTPPAVPSGLVAMPGEGQVSLSWSANTEPDLAGYALLRDGVEIAGGTGTSWLDGGLTNGTTYSYALVAVDTTGNRSAPSSPVPATPADAAPAAPTGVTAVPGDQRAVVAWTAPADTDVVGYRVLSEDGATVLATTTAPTTQAAVSGLTNGTAYRFTVVAVDAAGHVSVLSLPSAPGTPVSPTVPTLGAGESGGVAVSADGRYVVVGTRAALEASDTNTAYELYLVDRTGGTARRIAPLSAGATGASDPTNTAAPVVSADGGSIVLATSAALVPGDTNGLVDVYRQNTATRTWSLVSVPAGGSVNGSTAGAVLQTGASVYATSAPVALSADGDRVLFYSARPDLVAGDTNGVVDLFAKRISTGADARVSTTTAGGNLPGGATGPALALTPDGRFAVFPAVSAGGAVLLYRKTLSGAGAGDLVVVSSVTVGGRATQYAVYRDAGDIDVSDDGRYVALVTAARITTATPATMGSTGLAYRIDVTTGAVLALGTGQLTAWEHQVELDPTGRYAFFATAAAALALDTNGHTDHYRRDLAGGIVGPLVLATADAAGRATAGPFGSIAPAEYGRLIALTGDRVVVTTSQALVSADTNRLRDLYEKDLLTGTAGSPLG